MTTIDYSERTGGTITYYSAPSDFHPRSRKKIKFNPTSLQIDEATEKFLKAGGKITRVFVRPGSEVVAHPNDLLLDNAVKDEKKE